MNIKKRPVSEPPASAPSAANSILHLPQPEAWPDTVNGQALLTDIARRLQSYVCLPPWAAETLALWVVHTYAFELRDVSTYIGIESPEKRCGKTTLLRLLSQMVSRPVIAANISPPALFRVIQEARPTLLIDEADTFLEGNDELRGILNSGYERATAYVVRVRQGGLTHGRRRHRAHLAAGAASQLERFSCWCPKAMAAIGKLGETLSDRCITIRMQRKTSAETCAKLRDYADNGLRARCARFVLDNADAIKAARPVLPETLNDRAADIWEPLIVLADIAGGEWPDKTRVAAKAASELRTEDAPIATLLADIFIVFTANAAQKLTSAELVQSLEEFGDRPYRESLIGKPLTAIMLARILRPYGIEPRSLWVGGRVLRGFHRADFQEAFRRYLSKEEVMKFVANSKAQAAGYEQEETETTDETVHAPLEKPLGR